MASNTIKGRAELGANNVTLVRLLISHPMTVERRDAATGRTIDAHFIEEVTCEHGGDVVFSAVWGQAVSMNPFLQFSLLGAKKGDAIGVRWRDNKGDTDSTQIAIV